MLAVVQKALAEVDRTPARILVNPVRDGLNGKASNLLHGVAAARYRNLVMADADIAPGSDLLARLVPPLLDKRVGQVTALPVVKGARNLAGGLMALTWNMGLTSAWAPQAFLGVARTGPGACFAIRRDVLDRIGGYVSEDMAMCRRIREAGLGLALVRALWSDRVSWRGVAYRIRATVAGTSRSTQAASPSGRSHEQVCPISPDCAAARRKKRTDVPVLVGFRPEITSCGGTLSAFFCHRGRQLKKADR